MLIPLHKIKSILDDRKISIKGVLHVGAHECEELKDYIDNGVSDTSIDWVEANPLLVKRMEERGIKVHNAAISDTETTLPFYITNNGQSSSLLQFGTHQISYPWCQVCDVISVKTQTLENLIKNNNIPISERNFWNLDIQGVELSALKSAGDNINYADVIYTEINTIEVYKGCCLLPDLDSFLESKGFKRELIQMTTDGWGDALYIRTFQV
jgi:FkbM family methyltransferase